MYVVIRHYNKVRFSVICIECDGEFKSIMDEVGNDTGIETNCATPYDHGTEAERNNRVIKRGFEWHTIDFPIKIY